MKKTLLLFVLCLAFKGFCQISVSSQHLGSTAKLQKGSIEAFKATETIFVFSTIYDRETYEEILKDTWTVTPYKVVDHKDFDPLNYMDGKYSFAMVGGHKIMRQMNSGGSATYLYTYFDVFLFNMEDKKKEIAKYKTKTGKKKSEYNLMEENQIDLARFYLFGSDEFVKEVYTKSTDFVAESVYNKDVFYNYKPGFLKNYLQKVNAQLTKGEVYNMYDPEVKPEIAKLRTATLYVPSYTAINYNPWQGNYDEKDKEEKEELFEDYKYKYEYIEDDVLSKRIMEGEDIYYLRFVRVNSEKFIQVVSAKTGEVIYRDYQTGLNYQLKAGHLKDVSKAVAKGK